LSSEADAQAIFRAIRQICLDREPIRRPLIS
jgi:hypothetical protein